MIYVDMLDYDEVAHHAGPTRPESMRTLEGLDRVIQFFAELSDEVGRDYEIMVVTDHGQTRGSTFLRLEGRSLAACVNDLVDAAVSLDADQPGRGRTPAEMLGPVNLLSRRSERRDERARPPERRVEVVASGSIAHLYLLDEVGRLTNEQVDACQPALVPGLVALHHVGLVLTRRENGVVVVRNRRGRRELTPDGGTTGGEVCAFEELVRSHGGLGGWQTDALLVAPTHWRLPELQAGEVPDGSAVHRLLVSRLDELGLRDVSSAASVDEPGDARPLSSTEVAG